MKCVPPAGFIFRWKVLHTDSFWNRGKRWQGNGQFIFHIVLASVLWVTYALPNKTKQTSVGFCTLCYKHFMSIFRAANLKISRFVGEFDGDLPFELPTLRLRSKEERERETELSPLLFLRATGYLNIYTSRRIILIKGWRFF